jgi:hypothetical protein
VSKSFLAPSLVVAQGLQLVQHAFGYDVGLASVLTWVWRPRKKR